MTSSTVDRHCACTSVDMPSRRLSERARLPSTAERATIAAQIEVVRSIVDELERSLGRGGTDDARRELLVAEFARLGCLTLKVAASMLEHGADEGNGMGALLALVATSPTARARRSS